MHPHVKTGMSPAMLAFGTELRMPFDDVQAAKSEEYPKTDEEHRKLVAMREIKEKKGEDRRIRVCFGGKSMEEGV